MGYLFHGHVFLVKFLVVNTLGIVKNIVNVLSLLSPLGRVTSGIQVFEMYTPVNPTFNLYRNWGLQGFT